jgi:L-lactate dehydrogenase
MKHTKISIIGAGSVGSTIAYALLLKNIAAEVVLIDIDEIRCRGEILDLSDALSFCGPSLIHSGSTEDMQTSEIIIIAAGKRQQPGQERIALLKENKKVIESIINSIQPLRKDAIIIVVTNPMDLITRYAQELSHLPTSQVFGSGTFLDTQRLRGALSKKIKIAEQSIHAYILGEHGDTQFPAWSCARVAGISLSEFGITQKELDHIAHETISCKGATYYGIATCVAALCRTIIFDQKRVTPVSCYIKEFDVSLSMPVVLGAKGIEQILTVPLNAKEEEQLARSIKTLKSYEI